MSLSMRFSRLFARRRHVFAIGIAAITLFFAWQMRHLEVFTQFVDLLPRGHPYIAMYESYRDVYGNANTVVLEVLAVEGDIYRPQVLRAIDRATQMLDSSVVAAEVNGRSARSWVEPGSAVEGALQTAVLLAERLLPAPDPEPGVTGVDHNLVASLTHRTARDQRVDPDGTLRSPMLVPEIPTTPEALEALRIRVRRNPTVLGVLVSLDERAALVRASFTESRIDYAALFKHVQHVKRTLEAEYPVLVFVSGQPVLFGWTFAFASEILLVFGLTLVVSVLLLWAWFRRAFGVFLPLSGAAVNVVWGLGFAGWLGFKLDPLTLVVPMLITARAISHSVQFVQRFFEEYEARGDKEEACIHSMAELLLPGSMAILTDCTGLLTISLATIPLIRDLGLLAAFWAASIAITEMLLNRLLILYLPAPAERTRHVDVRMDRLVRAASALVGSRAGAIAVVAGFALFVAVASGPASRVGVGENRPGTPLLYPASEFNRAAAEIGERFSGLDDLLVVAHSEAPGRVYLPDALELIQQLQAVMETVGGAAGSVSFVDLLEQTSATFHNGDPRWATRMQTMQEVLGLTFILESSVPAPGILDPYRAIDQQSLSIRMLYPDHRADTVRLAMARLEEFARRERLDGSLAVRLREPAPGLLRSWLPWLDRLAPPPAPLLEVVSIAPDGVRSVLPVESGLSERLPDGSTVSARWSDARQGIAAEIRHASAFAPGELWIRRPRMDFEPQPTGVWLPDGVELRLAAGTIGVTAAATQEIEASHEVGLGAAFAVTFAIMLLSYRSLIVSLLLVTSLGVAALAALATQAWLGIAIDVNTLPVQAIGIGIGIDYAIYIVDRILQEGRRGRSRAEAVRRAVRTTGLAIGFTATTLLAGILFWIPISSLRFSAEMSLLLSILMAVNALGAVLLVPALVLLLPERLAGPFRVAAPPAR